MTYRTVLICLLSGGLPPAVVVVLNARPHLRRGFWSQPDVAIALGFFMDASRRALYLITGKSLVYPGLGWALWSYVSLSAMAYALWASVARIMRHRARNAEQKRLALQWLAEHQSDAP